MTVENSPLSVRDAASFRDPSGYVFKRQGRVFRAIDEDCTQIVRELAASGLLKRLADARLIVETHFVDEPALQSVLEAEHPPYRNFLEHEPIAPITYPHEWPISALAEAGLHTLELQTELLQAGYSLKDATAYNIQFVDNRPVFLDIPSIERPERLDVWTALGQFGQMFTFPLMLYHDRGWDFRSYFLGNLGGRDVEQVARGLGWLERWRPRYLFDVTLPAILTRRATRRGSDAPATLKKKPAANPASLLFILSRLRRKIERLLAQYKPSSNWADYTETCSYNSEADAAKRLLVAEYLDDIRPSQLLDAGCNTGEYSYIAAQRGTRVLAADSDHDAVELLRQRLKREPASIMPLVIDLCHPSPGIGYRNRERPGILDRLDVDCVLALALIHHLHVSGNLPLTAIRDLFHDVTQSHLILEFVPRDDVMFRQLTSFRRDLYAGYTLDACRSAFSETFEVLREDAIAGSPRTLLLLRAKNHPSRPVREDE